MLSRHLWQRWRRLKNRCRKVSFANKMLKSIEVYLRSNFQHFSGFLFFSPCLHRFTPSFLMPTRIFLFMPLQELSLQLQEQAAWDLEIFMGVHCACGFEVL